MGLMDWSRDKVQKVTQAYKSGSPGFGAIDAAVLEGADLQVPLDEARYTVIDTELTGLDAKRDSIVSMGAVKMRGTRIELGNTFYRLVSPRAKLTGSSVVIHGIMPSEVEAKPDIDAVLPEFLDFCGDDIIVGYVPSIDFTFINREMRRLYGVTVKSFVIDVLAVDRWVKQRKGEDVSKNPSLYEIAASYGIPVKGAHNAIFDAFTTAQVFQRLMHALKDLGIMSVGELFNVSNPPKGGEKFRFSFRFGSL